MEVNRGGGARAAPSASGAPSPPKCAERAAPRQEWAGGAASAAAACATRGSWSSCDAARFEPGDETAAVWSASATLAGFGRDGEVRIDLVLIHRGRDVHVDSLEEIIGVEESLGLAAVNAAILFLMANFMVAIEKTYQP